MRGCKGRGRRGWSKSEGEEIVQAKVWKQIEKNSSLQHYNRQLTSTCSMNK